MYVGGLHVLATDGGTYICYLVLFKPHTCSDFFDSLHVRAEVYMNGACAKLTSGRSVRHFPKAGKEGYTPLEKAKMVRYSFKIVHLSEM